MKKGVKIAGGTPGAQKPPGSARKVKIDSLRDHRESVTNLARSIETTSADTRIEECDFRKLEVLANVGPEKSVLFRSRVQTVVEFLAGMRAVRSIDPQRAREIFETKIRALETSRPDLEGEGVSVDRLVTGYEENISFIDLHFPDKRQKKENRVAVFCFIDLYRDFKGLKIAALSPGPSDEGDANALCIFVRACFELAGAPLSHDRIWDLVFDTLKNPRFDLGALFAEN